MAVGQQVWAQNISLKSTSIAPDADGNLAIKVSFIVDGCKDQNGRANVYFYSSDGTALKCFNGQYSTTNGEVAAWTDFTPPYESTTYTDFTVTIPSSELHCADGMHQLSYDLAIKCAGKWLYVGKKKYKFDVNIDQGKVKKLIHYNADGSQLVYTYGMCCVCVPFAGLCNVCQGRGRTYIGNNPCPNCNGTGQCTYCHGRGGVFTSSVTPAPSRSGASSGRSNRGGSAYGGYSGGNSYGGYSGGSSSGSYGGRSSKRTTRTCPSCGGTGKGPDEITWSPNYTGTDNSVYCPQCGRTTAAHSHRRPMCRTCYGKGTISN